jgi:hypothetical protein
MITHKRSTALHQSQTLIAMFEIFSPFNIDFKRQKWSQITVISQIETYNHCACVTHRATIYHPKAVPHLNISIRVFLSQFKIV